MTVPAQTPIISYVGNAISAVFSFPFAILDSDDLKVLLDGAPQSVGSQFSLNGIGNPSGGSIAFNTAPAAGAKVILYRDISIERDTDYQDNGDLLANTVNADFDRLWMALQDADNRESRAIQYPITEYATDGTLPAASDRAMKLIAFDESGAQTLVPLPSSIGAGDLKNESWTDGKDFTAGTSNSVLLSRAYTTKANLGTVVMQGIAQDPASYSISGNTLTFLDGNGAATPIPAGIARIWCVGGTTLSVFSPADGSVTADSLATGAVSAKLATEAITQLTTGKFYQSQGARITRLNDRVFIGAATVNTGNAASVEDWLSQIVAPTTATGQLAVLSAVGEVAVLAGTRTSDSGLAISGAEAGVAGSFFCVNDATGPLQQIGSGLYAEAQQKPGAGYTFGIEVDVANQSGSFVSINPYNVFPTGAQPCVNYMVGSGGARAGVTSVSAGMLFLNNGATFDKGIVFQAGQINSNEALALGEGHAIQWWSSATQGSGFLNSTGTAINHGITITDAGIFIGNSPASGGINSAGSLAALPVSGGVNVLAAAGGVPGAPVALSAIGSDTNIHLAVVPKGTGLVSLGGATATSASAGSATALPAAPAGYKTFIDNNSGVTYKFPYYNV